MVEENVYTLNEKKCRKKKKKRTRNEPELQVEKGENRFHIFFSKFIKENSFPL